MQITSKFRGKCRNCQGVITIGSRINWTRSTGAEHLQCDPNMIVGNTGKTRTELSAEWEIEHRDDLTVLDRFEKMRVSSDYADVPEDTIYTYASQDTQRNPYR